jgi:hypothetical protein
MNACRPQRGSIIKTIADGIAKRGFYIVPSPDQIPGCHRNNSKANLDRIQEFAVENAWRVTIHDENGWLLFTPDHSHPVISGQQDLHQHRELIGALLRGPAIG